MRYCWHNASMQAMPTLTIRNVPEATHAALRALAERHGRSVESEVRLALDHLAGAAARSMDPAERIRQARAMLGEAMLAGPSWADELIAERRAEAARE